jgi:alanine racemase
MWWTNQSNNFFVTYTVKHIADILEADASLVQPAEVIEQLSVDSRRISFPSTTLFFALQTSRRDAHIFIKELYDRNVKNFVVRKNYDAKNFGDANFIFVDDTLGALQTLAAYHRSHYNYPVIGITGSNGKTIVKEWLYYLLSPDYNIVRSPRSYNSQTGVPLSVWQMGEEHNMAIFEAGISMPGEMQNLEKIIQPTIGVFTNIGEAHRENFQSLLEKAIEKAKLFQCADVIIYCADDVPIQQAVTALPAEKFFRWSNKNGADAKIVSVEKTELITKINFTFNGKPATISIPFIDDASVQNACTCLSVLLYLKIPVETIKQRMLHLHPVSMRLQLVHGINNCVVVNDAYSFDINSFSVALDFLARQQQQPQRTVIISDIPSSRNGEAYEEVIEMLHTRKIQRVITIGEEWNKHQALTKRIPVTQHYHDTNSFAEHFSANHFRNEAILLKGARIFGFEKIVSLLERKVHQTVMEINLTAMAHNLNQYRSRLNKGVRLMAMVKAFAYGSGSAEVGNLVQFHKGDYLAVAYADEGVELRKAGISLPIMVLNVDDAAFETIVQNDLEPELFSLNIFQSFNSFLEHEGLQRYPVHIKIDTGMHRLGFEEKDLPALLPHLQNNHHIAVRSVFTHLAASEDPGEDQFTQMQARTFENCCRQIKDALGYNFIMHLSNSAAIFRNPSLQYDMVRLGIGLYGIDSSNTFQSSLQTVATLKTTIAQLRNVKAGDTVGYNRRGKVERDSVIATIRIGYADGFSRKLGSGNGKVFLNNKLAPTIGTVSMDMTMIDVTGIPGINEGEEVEIFGSNISVQQIAEWCDTIPYEILAGINQRVKRIYIEE